MVRNKWNVESTRFTAELVGNVDKELKIFGQSFSVLGENLQEIQYLIVRDVQKVNKEILV